MKLIAVDAGAFKSSIELLTLFLLDLITEGKTDVDLKAVDEGTGVEGD